MNTVQMFWWATQIRKSTGLSGFTVTCILTEGERATSKVKGGILDSDLCQLDQLCILANF